MEPREVLISSYEKSALSARLGMFGIRVRKLEVKGKVS
jgi:hypothetical protein